MFSQIRSVGVLLTLFGAIFVPSVQAAHLDASTGLVSGFPGAGIVAPAAKTVSVPTRGAYFGVWQRGMPQDFSGLSTFERDAGKHAAIVMFWRAMGGYSGTLDSTWLRAIARRGSVPMITWEPANWDAGSNQSAYSLSNIAAGRLDSYLAGWANQLRSYGGLVLIRWAHEMNGSWYPWGGQSPAQYVAAWKHIHAVFEAHGSSNVQWVWSPNVQWNQQSQFRPYYPGDAYVDWAALDGYNNPQNGWQSFGQIFNGSYGAIAGLTSKPLMIAEAASSEATGAQAAIGQSKAAWITDSFARAIPALPRIKAVLWFNEDKQQVENCTCNWPIESSHSAQQAFAQAISSPYYLSQW